MGDKRLEIIRRAKVLRAGEGNQEECRTTTEFTESKRLGNALHRHSTWHIKKRKSNGQTSGPKLTMSLTFKVGGSGEAYAYLLEGMDVDSDRANLLRGFLPLGFLTRS